mmetsp:Transcript_20887/g.43656  ORF Transcript_20887/g.43656 Transcript_20887/m.43656 type:complete len:241 (-) Transcript_20887:78-800(-)
MLLLTGFGTVHHLVTSGAFHERTTTGQDGDMFTLARGTTRRTGEALGRLQVVATRRGALVSVDNDFFTYIVDVLVGVAGVLRVVKSPNIRMRQGRERGVAVQNPTTTWGVAPIHSQHNMVADVIAVSHVVLNFWIIARIIGTVVGQHVSSAVLVIPPFQTTKQFLDIVNYPGVIVPNGIDHKHAFAFGSMGIQGLAAQFATLVLIVSDECHQGIKESFRVPIHDFDILTGNIGDAAIDSW